ncbi:MAG: 3-ketoacyl-ACP reductase [Acidobacteria bacterium]|nr:MAG: 3-ketoacyl-ACP reductase [Acidobacteriota bacterium]
MSTEATPPAAVLVTGASRGLGRGIAETLARDGLDVAIHYGRNREAAQETEATCRAAATRPDQRFVLVGGDVASRGDRQRILDETLAGLGRLDALVNNAGMAPRARVDLLDATEESFDELVAVNLKGPYFLSQAAARHWIAKKGVSRLPGGYKLVFISSISATHVSLNRGEYCVSKAGLAMAAKLWAARLAADGVQVFEVRPGIMATDMTAGVKEHYDRLLAEGLVPQKRWGTAEDVGRAVSALLKGSLPFSTGDVLHVDGGLHLERL